MPKVSPIITFFLLLLAATALTFSSCNVSKKGGSRKKIAPVEISPPPATGQDTIPDEGELPESPADELPETGSEIIPDTEVEEVTPHEGDQDVESVEGQQEPPVADEEEIPYEDETPTDDIEVEPVVSGQGEIGPVEAADADSLTISLPEGETVPGLEDGEQEAEGGETEEEEGESETTEGEGGPAMKVIEFEADIMRNIHITEDSTATNLLGNVVMYHNGAVITCDSAVRYSENRMDFFKRVIINNGTTYVYGDRATYNGETNIARVFAPIVKTVDEDAVLYTYNFIFNTQTNIGRYSGGGVFTQEDNRMESDRGWYNTDTREFTGAGDVELVNPDYKLISDSVRYNLDTEIAEFFVKSYIWNSKGEILIADRGKYRNSASDYEFTRNSYILTEEQEIWADSMRHFSEEDYTILRRDIQIIDEENNAMAFGDYGEYWGETEHGMMTLDPALISFDPEEPADTLYMRSDSMFFYTYDYDHVFSEQEGAAPSKDEIPIEELIGPSGAGLPAGLDLDGISSAQPEGLEQVEGLPPGFPPLYEETGVPTDTPEATDESGLPDEIPAHLQPDDEPVGDIDPAADVTVSEESPTVEQPPLSAKEARKQQKAEEKAARRERKQASKTIIDGETEAGEEDTDGTESPDAVQGGDEEGLLPDGQLTGDIEESESHSGETEQQVAVPEPYVSRYAELAVILQDVIAADSAERELTHTEFWLHVRGGIEADSTKLEEYTTIVDQVITTNQPDISEVSVPEGGPEEIIGALIEEAVAESESMRAIAEATQERDSVQRVFYGYRDVRIYREDLQAVCDSIVGFSKDSTLHLHIDPVMWSDENQVTSDVMVIFTRDEQLYKAEFTGSPFMASVVDSTRYNQIKGRSMTAWFRDNTIYRHDVFGNGQNYYYMEDEKTGDIDAFMTVECADITYFIEDNTIDEIVWRVDPVYFIYPIEKIPPEIDQFLPGFKWEAERRPMTREDVFNRTIRERRREEVLAIPHPQFPINEAMEANKQRLTQLNQWRDRNDRLSPQALEFIQYVELKNAEAQLEAQE